VKSRIAPRVDRDIASCPGNFRDKQAARLKKFTARLRRDVCRDRCASPSIECDRAAALKMHRDEIAAPIELASPTQVGSRGRWRPTPVGQCYMSAA